MIYGYIYIYSSACVAEGDQSIAANGIFFKQAGRLDFICIHGRGAIRMVGCNCGIERIDDSLFYPCHRIQDTYMVL